MTLITKAQTEQLLANGRAQRAAIDRQDQAHRLQARRQTLHPRRPMHLAPHRTRRRTDLAFGLCDLGLGCPELGYVSLTELRSVRGKLGLPIERDLHFDADKTISAYADEARTHGRIVT